LHFFSDKSEVEMEGRETFEQHFSGETYFEQSTENHIASSTRKGIEMQDSLSRRSFTQLPILL